MKPDVEDSDLESQSTTQKNTSVSRGDWRSPIIRAEDGRVIGATLFFTADDLEMLGIDTRSTEEIHYTITEERLIQIKNCE